MSAARTAAVFALAAAATSSQAFDPTAMREQRHLQPVGADLGPGQLWMTAFDADGDGIDELAVAGPNHWLALRHDPATRTWATLYRHTSNSAILGLSPGDFDGDGMLDIAVLRFDRLLQVFDAEGGGLRFEQPLGFSSPIAFSTLDLDPRPGDEVVVLNGNAVFAYRPDDPMPLWSFDVGAATRIAAAQVDLDPQREVLVTAICGSPGQIIDPIDLYQEWFAVPGLAGELDTGDLDGGGIDEIVTVCGSIHLLDAVTQSERWSSGSGDFARVVDLDHDGRGEVVTFLWNRIAVLDGQDGKERAAIVPGAPPRAAVAAELDGDCEAELVWLSGNPPLLQVLSGVALVPEGEVALGFSCPAWSLAAADLDRDGRPELLHAECLWSGTAASSAVSRLDLGSGEQRRVASFPSPGLRDVRGLATLDLDADAQLEYLVPGRGAVGGSVGIAVLDGLSDALEWHSIPLGAERPTAIATGDIDGDGHADIVAGTGGLGSGSLWLLRASDGAPLWRGPQGPLSGPIEDIRIADFDGDGEAEIAAAAMPPGLHVINGRRLDLAWTPPEPLALSLEAADGDGDGVNDLVVGTVAGEIALWDVARQRALGRAQLATGPVRALRVVDVDGDGQREIVAAAGDGAGNSGIVIASFPSLSWLWRSAPFAGDAGVSSSLIVADLDHDGKLEIAVATGRDGIRILEYDAGPPDSSAPLWPSVTPALVATLAATRTCCALVELGWDRAEDAEGPPLSYRVYRGSLPDFPPSLASRIAETSGLGWNDGRVSVGETWYYRVRAVDAAGNEDDNPEILEVAIADPDALPLDVGNLLRVSHDQGLVRLDFVGAPGKLWRIYRDEDKRLLGGTAWSGDRVTTDFLESASFELPALVFYRVRGLSACTRSPGP